MTKNNPFPKPWQMWKVKAPADKPGQIEKFSRPIITIETWVDEDDIEGEDLSDYEVIFVPGTSEVLKYSQKDAKAVIFDDKESMRKYGLTKPTIFRFDKVGFGYSNPLTLQDLIDNGTYIRDIDPVDKARIKEIVGDEVANAFKLPEKLKLKESLDEYIFNSYVDNYIKDNLEELKREEIESLYDVGFDDEDLEKEINKVKNIHSIASYRNYIGDGIDFIENKVLEELQDKYSDICELIYHKVEELLKEYDKENKIELRDEYSRSWSSGDFTSYYITLINEDGIDKVIRVCDGHDNGRGGYDLEIVFTNLLENENFYDTNLEDLIDDITYEQYLEELNLKENLLNESKADLEKFRQWCGDDDLYNRFINLKPRLANMKFMDGSKGDDIYSWMKYNTPLDLENTLLDIEATPTKKEREKRAQEGAKLLYNNGGWKVFKIETLEASQKYGRDTTWCISGREAGEYFPGHEDCTYFFIDTNNDKKYALIWDKGRNFWTIYDELDEIIPYIPNAPKVSELPDVSTLPQELCNQIAQVLGINASDIEDIWSADNNPELMELFLDFDSHENYVVDTKEKMYYIINGDTGYEDVTQEIQDDILEYGL